MMLFVGNGPEYLPIAYRLGLMGHQIGVYVHDPHYDSCYQHIIARLPRTALKDAVMHSDVTIVDNARLAHDLDLPHRDSSIGIALYPETDESPLQDFVTGWWTGTRFSFFTHTYQEHGVLTGNVGPLAGGSHVGATILTEGDDLLQEQASKLLELRYVGPVVRQGRSYYLGHPWDSTYATLSLVRGPRDQFWLKKFNVELYPGIAAWIRVYIPPYPLQAPSVLKTLSRHITARMSDLPFLWGQDIMLDAGGLRCGCCNGMVGVVTASGRSPHQVASSMRRNLRKLQSVAGDLAYRTDYKQVIGELNGRYHRDTQWDAGTRQNI